MKTRTTVIILGAAAVLGTIVQCGGSNSSPTTNPTPLATVTATPTAPPPAGTALPAGMVCSPTPPPLYGMQLKVHAGGAGRAVLDSKPLVWNVDNYCERVNDVGGRFCETRKEGNDQRVACDYMAVGKSPATGRWGPTWYYNGQACDGPNSGSCANHPTEQFLAIAKAPGRYEACASPNVAIQPEGGPCGGIDFK